jgi:hypothetical protein
MQTIEGGCGCGAVRYVCRAEPVAAAYCQCRACQKDTGGGHSAHIGVPAAAVTITGQLRHWQTRADSGAAATRGFCPVCGSSLSFHTSGWPDVLFLAAGSLDDPSLFKPQMVVFAASAPPWDHIDPTVPRFPGMPSDP